MDPVRMIGLWERKDKKGIIYLSDKQHGTSSVMVMPNTFRKESGDPDYFLYMKPDKEERNEEIPEELPLKGKTSIIRKCFKDFFENY
jgi:hypothetical protein